jgi:hypothetical protein
LTLHSLSLISPTAPAGAVVLLMENVDAEALKKNTLTIKEGVEYHVAIKFSVGAEVLSGLKYLHVVKRAGVTGEFVLHADEREKEGEKGWRKGGEGGGGRERERERGSVLVSSCRALRTACN